MDQRIVALEHSIHQEHAQPGPGKHDFEDHGDREQFRDLHPENRHGGNHAVSERVPVDHRTLAQAFAPRGADVLLVQHIQHAGANQPAHDRDLAQAENQAWKQERPEPLRRPDRPQTARDGKQVQFRGQEQQGNQRNPKAGHRHPKKGKERAQVVDEGIRFDGRDHPEWDGDDCGYAEREDGQLQGCGKAGEDHLADVFVSLERSSQISTHDVAEPFEVADVERLVESQFRPDGRNRLFICAQAQHHPDGIAGREINQQGRKHCHDEEHRHHQHDPVDNELKHQMAPSSSSHWAAMPGEDMAARTAVSACRFLAPDTRPADCTPEDA